MNNYENPEQDNLHAKQEEAIASLQAEQNLGGGNDKKAEVTRAGLLSRLVDVYKANEAETSDELKRRRLEKVKATAAMLLGLIPVLGTGEMAASAGVTAAVKAETVAAKAATAAESAAPEVAETVVSQAAKNGGRMKDVAKKIGSKEFQSAANKFLNDINPVPDVPEAITAGTAVVSLAIPEVAVIPPMIQYIYSTYREAILSGKLGIDMIKEAGAWGKEKIADIKAAHEAKQAPAAAAATI